MQNFNYHSHTKRCEHAIGEDEEYVKAAIANGFQVMGFSDDITRENVRDKLAAIDFSGGLTGQIKFDETGSLDRRYIICEIVDGEYVKRAGFDYPEQVAAGK